MGPLVMVGLAALGAAPAIGWISASTWRPPELFARGVPSARALTVVSMAFCAGLGILGFVIGILAVYVGGGATTLDEVMAALPAVAGALIGLAMTQRERDRTDAAMAIQAGTFLVALGVLGVIAAFLATTVPVAKSSPGGSLFAILGLVEAGAALGIGATSARSIRSMQGANADTVAQIYRRQIGRSGVFQLAGVGAFVVAMLTLLG